MKGRLYQIVLSTPMGKRNGQLCLCESDNMLTGYLDILQHRNEIENGNIVKGVYTFSGELVTLVRNIAFIAVGRADNNSVSFHIKADHMEMHLSGSRISDWDGLNE